MRRARPLLLVAALLGPAALAGCLELEAAHVPETFLTRSNGWAADPEASDEEPSSSGLGTTRTQRLAYKDAAADGRGYPGQLVVYTFRTLVAPSEESLRDEVQEQVRTYVESQGVRLDGEAHAGSRTLANGAESSWFVYNGTVTQESGLFTRNAKVKVAGEVFRCRAERTSVVALASAQVTNVRTLGGVPYSTNSDDTTWREVVSDPDGSIPGLSAPARGAAGLIYNVACS